MCGDTLSCLCSWELSPGPLHCATSPNLCFILFCLINSQTGSCEVAKLLRLGSSSPTGSFRLPDSWDDRHELPPPAWRFRFKQMRLGELTRDIPKCIGWKKGIYHPPSPPLHPSPLQLTGHYWACPVDRTLCWALWTQWTKTSKCLASESLNKVERRRYNRCTKCGGARP